MKAIFVALTILSLLTNSLSTWLPAAPAYQAETPPVRSTPTATETAPPPPEETPEPTPVQPIEATPTPEPTETVEPPAPTIEIPPVEETPAPEETPIEPVGAAELDPVLTAHPAQLIPGEDFRLAWDLGARELPAGLALTLTLPDGVTPELADGLEWDAAGRTLTFFPADLAGMLRFSLDARARGPFTLRVAVSQDGAPLLEREFTFEELPASLLDAAGGQADSLNGEVSVIFAADIVDRPVQVRIYPALDAPATLGRSFEISARDETGEEVHELAQPVIIALRYREADGAGDETSLTLFTYDESQQSWEPLHSWVDAEANILYAEARHFSLFGFDVQDWEAARLPSLSAAQVSGYTGSASYSLPVALPPGPGGAQPSLALSYSSAAVDSASGRTQASWAGMGWSVDTGFIQRDMHGTMNDDGDDTFSLNANGVGGMLLMGTDGYYHTADESFWRVYYNTTTNTWTAWDKSGTVYTFGETDDARATYPVFDCPNDNYALYTWKWGLNRVRTLGNSNQDITYTYFKESKTVSGLCEGDVSAGVTLAMYPATIQWAGGRYQVTFNRDAGRDDRDPYWNTPNSRVFFQTQRLTSILVQYKPVGSGTFSDVRLYELKYYNDDTPSGDLAKIIFPNYLWNYNDGTTLTLKSIQEKGKNTSSWDTLPATTFTYGDGMHLTEVDNGYGAQAEFSYDSQGWHESVAPTSQEIIQEFNSSSYCNQGNNQGGWSGVCETSPDYRLRIFTEAYRVIDPGLLHPGGWYELKAELSRVSGSTTAKLGLSYDGTNKTWGSNTTIATQPDFTIVSAVVWLSGQATNQARFVVNCENCKMRKFTARMLTTAYRALAQTLYDDLTLTGGATTTYRYSGAATNDPAHSEQADYYTDPNWAYNTPYSEFRGHAFVESVSPTDEQGNFLAVDSWYAQDDVRSGSLVASLSMRQDFWDDFAAYQTADWTGYQEGSAQKVTTLSGEKVLENTNTAANWNQYVLRDSYSVSDREAVLVSFQSTTTSLNNLLVIDGTVGNYRFGLKQAGTTLYANYREGSSDSSYHDVTLSGITYAANTWYVLLMVVDADGFLLRVWQRDDPSQMGEYRRDMAGTDGQSWRFRQLTYNGTVYLDDYREGVVYSMDTAVYADIDMQIVDEDYLPDHLDWSPQDEFHELAIYWNRLDQSTHYVHEGHGAVYAATRTSYTYATGSQGGAQYGNLTSQVEYEWKNNAWVGQRKPTWVFYPKVTTSLYLTGLPAYDVTYRCDNADCSTTTLVSLVYLLYDSNTLYNQQPTVGRLTRTRTRLFAVSGTWRYADVKYEYDSYGNQSVVRRWTSEGIGDSFASGGEQATTTTYDSTYHTYPVLVQTPVTAVHTHLDYDYALGLPTQETDGNDANAYAVYDRFGRMTSLVLPYDSFQSPSVTISYSDTVASYPPCPGFCITITQKLDANISYTTERYYNGLGQLIQQQGNSHELSAGTYDVATDYWYDRRGQLYRQSVPYTLPDGSGYDGTTMNASTIMEYDLLGRAVTVTAPDGSSSTTSFDLISDSGEPRLVTEISDPLTHTTESRSDVWGQVRKVIPPTGPGVSYTYDVLGQLTQAVYGSATTSLSYDLAGRKTQMADADMGTWNYTFDALGNLKTQTDARSCVTTLSYDTLNRLTGKVYSGTLAACNNTPDVTYTYDGGTNGKGRRTGMSTILNSITITAATWSYDLRGRVLQEYSSVYDTPTQNFATDWTYNSANLVITMQYPYANGTREVITYAYKRQMAVNSVTGASDYLKTASYDEAGRAVWLNLGWNGSANILRVNYSYNAWDTQGGRIQQIQAGIPTNLTSLQDLEYDYDASGNINWIKDNKAGSPQQQSFTYDAMNRLKTAQATGGTYGTYALEKYVYDASTGNYTNRTDASDVTLDSRSYGTQASDCPATALSKAHAVTQFTSGGTTHNYCYDQNGNMVRDRWGTNPIITRTYTYDAENRLVGVSGDVSATFVYDGDGRRVKATVGAANPTYYIGSHFEITNNVATKYYDAGGRRIAMNVGGTLYYLLGDHLGSTSITADSAGAKVAELRYKPWGDSRYTYGTTPTSRRYTGQIEESSLGLYFYNARFYSPVLGRFVSADTIIPQPGNPVAWDRYAYVGNNPVRYIDPSGHDPICNLYLDGQCVQWSDPRIPARFGIRERLAWFGITAEGNWSYLDLVQIYHEAQLMGAVISRDLGGRSSNNPHRDFKRVMGNKTTVRVNTYSLDENGIHETGCYVQSMALIVCGGGVGKKLKMYANQGLITHEYGHILDLRSSSLGFSRVDAAVFRLENRVWFSGASSPTGGYHRGFAGYGCATFPCVQHPATIDGWDTPTEDFADMWMNYVLGSFSDDFAGRVRMNFMIDLVPNVLNAALNHPS